MELRRKERVSYCSSGKLSSKDELESSISTLSIVNSKSFRPYKKDLRSDSVFKIGCHSQSSISNEGKKNKRISIKEEMLENVSYSISGSNAAVKVFSGVNANDISHIAKAEHSGNLHKSKKSHIIRPDYNDVEQQDSKFPMNELNCFKDFVPLYVVNSIIPQLFRKKFPLLNLDNEKYTCQWCVRDRSQINKWTFKDIFHLVRHYSKEHSEIPVRDYNIQCNECRAYFFHEKTLETHFLNGLCHKHILEKGYSNKGVALSKDAMMIICPFCEMAFLSKKRFRKHFNHDENGCKFENIDHPMEMGIFDYIKCKFCEENFLLQSDYKEHLQHSMGFKSKEVIEGFKCRNVSKFLHTCSVCLQEYETYLKYKQHLVSDHKIEEFEFNCERCGKHFYSENLLTEHRARNFSFPHCFDMNDCRTIPKRANDPSNSILKVFECPVCSFKNYAHQRFARHLTKCHPDFVSPWVCPECNMSFMSVHKYEKHMTKWKCPFCDEIFIKGYLLRTHCRARHANKELTPSEQRPVCDICGATRSTIHTMQRHKILFHNNLSECPFCGETDEDHPNMFTHVASHAYKAPRKTSFLCNICDNKPSFDDEHRLKRHIAQVHQKSENTVCDICNKTFAQKATMMRHRRIHLDIKPFKCNICDLPFTQKTGMKAHRVRHYNKDGSLKSPEEIKQQVEIIKQQRESVVQNTSNEGESKKRKKTKHHCYECGKHFKSRVKYDSHQCLNKSKKEEECLLSGNTDDDSGNHNYVQQHQFNCSSCKKAFVSANRLDHHRCKKESFRYNKYENSHPENQAHDENSSKNNEVENNAIQTPTAHEQFDIQIENVNSGDKSSETIRTKNTAINCTSKSVSSKNQKRRCNNILDHSKKNLKISSMIKEPVEHKGILKRGVQNKTKIGVSLVANRPNQSTIQNIKIKKGNSSKTDKLRDKYALREKTSLVHKTFSESLDSKKRNIKNKKLSKNTVIYPKNSTIDRGLNINEMPSSVSGGKDAELQVNLERQNGIDFGLQKSTVADHDNNDPELDCYGGLDQEQKNDAVGAESFVDIIGGFNCRKCRAIFSDMKVFKHHTCIVFQA